MTCSVLLATFWFGVIMIVEINPLWFMTSRERGGIDFDTNEIGIVRGSTGIFGVVVQLILYPVLDKKFGVKNVFIFSCLVLVVNAWSFTETRLLLPSDPEDVGATIIFWIVILAAVGIFQQFALFCSSALNLMINNSASLDKIGTINGIAMSMSAFFRSLAPTIGASAYSWSVGQNTNYLISFRFAYILSSLLLLCATLICAKWVPASINSPYKR